MKSQSEISSAMSIRHELINFYVITTGFQNSQFHIGQARWSQIVHTITSPPSLLRHHSSAFLLLTEPIRQKYASYFFQKYRSSTAGFKLFTLLY